MRRLIIGCGYLGRRVAEVWRARGDEVFALTRSAETAEQFAQKRIIPIVGDVLEQSSLVDLPSVDTVLYAVGYDRTAGPSRRTVYVDGLHNVLTSLSSERSRFLYVSSTSVYGQSDGEWIDESSPCEPTSDRGRICLDAENVLRQRIADSTELTILRLSGIYGPGRLAARVEALREQRPISGNPHGWLNLIHVDDAVKAVLACSDRDRPLDMLLVSDDRPLLRRDYYDELTQALDTPPPTWSDDRPQLDLGKRCRNRRLREQLGVDLAYSTIREGLPAALDDR